MAELIQNFVSGQIILFLIFGLGAVVSAITMVLYPNPIRSALFLVLNLFCVAVLYLLLNAYFLAAVQVIVYAGAIMVLFLFVIMLLNLGTPDRQQDRLRWQQPVALVGGIALAILLGVAISSAPQQASATARTGAAERPVAAQIQSANGAARAEGGLSGGAPLSGGPALGDTTEATPMGPVPTEEERAAALAARAETQGTTIAVGRNLYDVNQPYLFPFEVTSILLLVAVIGSVVLAKRRMPGENLGSMRSDTFDGTGEAN